MLPPVGNLEVLILKELYLMNNIYLQRKVQAQCPQWLVVLSIIWQRSW